MLIDRETLPVVLIGGLAEPSLASLLQTDRYALVEVPSGARVLEWARDTQPDLIVLQDHLPDMAGIEACELLRRDPRIGHNVPILILAAEKPTPEQRVTALGTGAWDFLQFPGDPREIRLKLQSYLQAKRNLDLALAEGLVDPVTGLHSRIGLARRARELGALMSRRHGALSCVVFSLESDTPDPRAGSLVARTARVSDVVGALSPTEFVVLAPGTDESGVLRLAQRVGGALSAGIGGRTLLVPGSNLRAGYEAVANLTYSPIDPVELLTRAAAAVRNGKPESGSSWLRRFEAITGSGQGPGSASPTAPSRVEPDQSG